MKCEDLVKGAYYVWHSNDIPEYVGRVTQYFPNSKVKLKLIFEGDKTNGWDNMAVVAKHFRPMTDAELAVAVLFNGRLPIEMV